MMRRFMQIAALVATPTICYSTAVTRLSNCDLLKEEEKKYYALINDRTPHADIGAAQRRNFLLEESRKNLALLHTNCEAEKEQERQKLMKEIEAEAVARRNAEAEKLRRDAPRFFNHLVELVETDDPDMRNGILRQIAQTGNANYIILFSSSEWDPNIYMYLPGEKQPFRYSDVTAMSFQGLFHRVNNPSGDFRGYTIDSQRVWKRSIFFIPTRENRIVLRK